MQIGIIAPSSPAPKVETLLGVKRLKSAGFEVRIHPQCYDHDLFFAGQDLTRAQAFWEFASDPDLNVLWCARGGYGAVRVLPYLKQWTQKFGPPPKGKLLVAYSDSTLLMEFVRKHWGWHTLHGPMPGLKTFSLLPESEFRPLVNWIQKRSSHPRCSAIWEGKKLQFWTPPPKKPLTSPLVGGNLTVWNSVIGTGFELKAKDSLLFFEDVGENLYRLDRMLQQLAHSHSIQKTKGIVLGTFLDCKDVSPSVLKPLQDLKGIRLEKALRAPLASQLKPLRPTTSAKEGLQRIWSEFGQALKLPVAGQLPVGHGPEFSPLPLGATYCLKPNGVFTLTDWEYLK